MFTVCTANTLTASPSPPALPAGPAAGGMGAAAEAHPPVFPDRRLRLHGIVQGVGLQAPLERRAVRPPAGRPNGHPGGEWRVPSCFSGGLGWVIGCKHEFRK